MTCFHWISTTLNPSNSSCGFLCHFQTFALQQNLFYFNLCSLCESLWKGKILMSHGNGWYFSPSKINNFAELSREMKITGNLSFLLTMLFPFIISLSLVSTILSPFCAKMICRQSNRNDASSNFMKTCACTCPSSPIHIFLRNHTKGLNDFQFEP